MTALPMRRDDQLHLHGDEQGTVTLHNVAVRNRSAGSPSPGGATTLDVGKTQHDHLHRHVPDHAGRH